MVEEPEEPLYWGKVVDATDFYVTIQLPRDNHSTGVVGTYVKVFTDEDRPRKAKIEKVAKAIHESDYAPLGRKWGERSPEVRESYLRRAEAALGALEEDDG